MKEIPEYEKDLASIRAMMERTVKFASLSGLSGVLAGMYALVGAGVAYYWIYFPNAPMGFRFNTFNEGVMLNQLIVVAMVVVVASLLTGYALSLKKAKKLGVSIWNAPSKQLLIDLFIPLVAGGLLLLILLWRGYFSILASACLVFYGLGLVSASRTTYKEVWYLGLLEIGLGLLAALLPGYGLVFWALGFGVLHLVYGIFMHYRYDQ